LPPDNGLYAGTHAVVQYTEMTEILVNVLLLQAFTLLVVLSVKGRRNIRNALIIFHSINMVKILFLFVWAIHKTGIADLNYLQFPDEHYYLSESHDATGFANLYHLLVVAMRAMGFSISNMKMVNILVSSFAIVRLYTLKAVVAKPNQYVVHLFVFCGILFLHVIYFSVFVLKDVIFFYVTAEFLIQLINRSRGNRWVLIALLAIMLVLLRPLMVLVFCVFLFDCNWRLRWTRVLVLTLVCGLLVAHRGARYQQRFYRLLSHGFRESAGDMPAGLDRRTKIAYAESVIIRQPGIYGRHILRNMIRATVPGAEPDMTVRLSLLLQWGSLLYLLVVKKGISRLWQWWPILSIGALYFIGGVMTLYNVRYNVFPLSILLCVSVFAVSRPIAGVAHKNDRVYQYDE